MTKELAVVDPQNAVDAYRMSTDAAGLCKEIVLKSVQDIKGKKYVKVEGWQSIAIAHGCTASSGEVEKVEGGIRAIGKVIRMSDGMVLSQAEGFVGDDEKTWAGRPEYARRAMAQTRAISRACRSAFAHVVVMMNAGLSTTPAEEVPGEGFEDRHEHHEASPKTPAQVDENGHCTIITGIEKVTAKDGTKKDGTPWTLYTIYAGERYTTFDKKMAEVAKAASEDGRAMVLTYMQTEKSRNLVNIGEE